MAEKKPVRRTVIVYDPTSPARKPTEVEVVAETTKATKTENVFAPAEPKAPSVPKRGK